MEELFRLMERWPDVALERVQRAEKWHSGSYFGPDGSRCIAGHAIWNDDASEMLVDYTINISCQGAPRQFDDLSAKHGADVVGRECSARAAEILAARRALKAEEAHVPTH